MKTASAALQAHLSQETMTLAYLWKVARVDGAVLGFTTHDRDISYGGVTYEAATGFTNTATSSHSNLSVDNSEVTGFLEADAIIEDDIRAGLYDGSDIEIRLVNWADLTMGDVLLRKGTIGMVTMKNNVFTAEIRGLAHKLTTIIGASYGPICRATFGSGLNGIDMNSHYLCKFDVTTVHETGTLAAVLDNRTLMPVAGLTATVDWFNDGFLTFTSGTLNGVSAEIKKWDGAVLELFLSLPRLPAAGDHFTIEAGCNKTTDDCQGKFSNIVNFRGEPFIPGMDQLLDYPSAT